jgi:hypothetical protein
MGISAYKEVTEWDNSEFVVPNHTYLFDGKSNILAYAKASNDELVIMNKPMKIDTRRRKFEKVRHDALEALGKTLESVQEAPQGIAVQSDSGKTYYITESNGNYRCNCVGFGYRGKCKHIDVARKQQSGK